MVDRITKNLTANDILNKYTIGVDYNTYYVDQYSKKYTGKYDVQSFEETSPHVDESTLEFNSDTTFYNTQKIYQPYSLIISNIGQQNGKIYPTSYIMYYNSTDGLHQMSYVLQEGNGLYYDPKTYMMTFNIDDKTIKEIDNKLYFNTQSIPTSTSDRYGIHNVNAAYFTINNGIISSNEDIKEKVISLKNISKYLYITLQSLYEQFNYLLDEKMNMELEDSNFSSDDESFEETSGGNEGNDEYSDNSQQYQIDTSIINSEVYVSYEFINNDLKYIDNYYYSSIPELQKFAETHNKYEVPINDSRIIYTKDIDYLQVIITSQYNTNKELKTNEDYLTSYLSLDYTDSNNRFSTLNYIEKMNCKLIDGQITMTTYNRVKYKNNKSNNKYLFEKYGLTLSNKLSSSYYITKNSSLYQERPYNYEAEIINNDSDEEYNDNPGIISNDSDEAFNYGSGMVFGSSSTEWDYYDNSITVSYYYPSSTDNIKIIYDNRTIRNCLIIQNLGNYGDSQDGEYIFIGVKKNVAWDPTLQLSRQAYEIFKKIGLIWTCKDNNIYLGWTPYNTGSKTKDGQIIWRKRYYPIWQHNISTKYLYSELALSNKVFAENRIDLSLDLEDYPDIGSDNYIYDKDVYTGEYKYIPDDVYINLYRITGIRNITLINLQNNETI